MKPPPESRPAQKTKHVTIESGHDPRLFSDTYATPLRIHIGDDLVYDSESRPEPKIYDMPYTGLQHAPTAEEEVQFAQCPSCGKIWTIEK